MDYYQIGQRIRQYRKAHGLSQEQLAEQVGISVTHMSHIETGNTKLSLPVLVALAQALEVSTDALLGQRTPQREVLQGELSEVVKNCSTQQLHIITDTVRTIKIALEKYKE